jgi:lipopolysaccharide transport system permease protein
MLRGMGGDLVDSRHLAWRLFVRNIKGQFRQTVLGYFWLLAPPLFSTVIWVFLNKARILKVGETAVPYPVYVLTGNILWQSFVRATTRPMAQMLSNKGIISKINLPKEAFVVSSLGGIVFELMVRMTLLVPVFWWFGVDLGTSLLLAPVGIVAILAFGMSLSLLLLPINSLFTDIQKGIPMAMRAWFFLTPIIYPPPESGIAAVLADYNPVSPLLITTRDWMTGQQVESLVPFFILCGITVVLLLIGWIMMRVAMPHLIERMNA